MSDEATVGIGELKLATKDGELVAYALGSCIALCLYDPIKINGAMCHILLPGRRAEPRDADQPIAYYADTAVFAALKIMEKAGSRKENIVAAMVGGARMFPYGGSEIMNVGERNIEAVTAQLNKLSIPLEYSSVGGTRARTVRFSMQGNSLSELISVK